MKKAIEKILSFENKTEGLHLSTREKTSVVTTASGQYKVHEHANNKNFLARNKWGQPVLVTPGKHGIEIWGQKRFPNRSAQLPVGGYTLVRKEGEYYIYSHPLSDAPFYCYKREAL